MVAVAGMWLVGIIHFNTAQLGFVVLAALIPLLTATLTYKITKKTKWAYFSGLLGVFCGFYLPYLTTTDTFPIYMVLGGAILLILPKFVSLKVPAIIISGVLAGLLHLSRADGIVWLIVLSLVLCVRGNSASTLIKIRVLAIFITAYLVVMGPWMVRNFTEFGTYMSPGGTRTLWLKEYDELFSYPASKLTFENWWSTGIKDILNTRLWALRINLQRILAEQGLIFLTPLMIFGLWHHRSDVRVQTGVSAWLLTLGMMTIIFPFAGARGGFFHSSAGIQPLFWSLVPTGLDRFVDWGDRKRGWNPKQAQLVFGVAIIILAAILSITLFYQRVIGPNWNDPLWEKTASIYRDLEEELQALGASKADIVMVKNPPGYYVENYRSAIVIPNGDLQTLISVGHQYDARYILLDQDHPGGLYDLYNEPNNHPDEFKYLKTVKGIQIFRVE
jgi:hypothetical protein